MLPLRLIVTSMEYEGRLRMFCILEEDGKIIEILPEENKAGPEPGEIYVAAVETMPKNLDAAFVRIAPEIRCYLPLKEASDPVYVPGRRGEAPLRAGDILLVQIIREQIKSKLPSVSARLSVPGRYIVLTTAGTGISLSRKLSGEEKQRLSAVFREMASEYGDHALIVRTNAAGIPEAEIRKEYAALKETFDHIVEKGRSRALYTCLQKKEAGYIRMLRDIPREQLREIVTDDETVLAELQGWCRRFAPDLLERIRFYDDRLLSLPKLIRLEKSLEEAMSKKVWLKCGGFLVIEQTEAFVAVDVNSGKYTSRKKPEEAFREVNLEAASEIARQLRLRNLSGVILIDFINMNSQDHEEELFHVLRKHLKKDPVRTEAVDMTSLHIAEVTRQKVRPSLFYSLSGKEDPREAKNILDEIRA